MSRWGPFLTPDVSVISFEEPQTVTWVTSALKTELKVATDQSSRRGYIACFSADLQFKSSWLPYGRGVQVNVSKRVCYYWGTWMLVRPIVTWNVARPQWYWAEPSTLCLQKAQGWGVGLVQANTWLCWQKNFRNSTLVLLGQWGHLIGCW